MVKRATAAIVSGLFLAACGSTSTDGSSSTGSTSSTLASTGSSSGSGSTTASSSSAGASSSASSASSSGSTSSGSGSGATASGSSSGSSASSGSTGGGRCTPGSCGTGRACDSDTNSCVAAACDPSASQPGGCGHGSVCRPKSTGNEATVCTATGVCRNLRPTTPVLNASPVIFDIRATTSRTSTVGCSPGVVQKFEGSFYDPQGDMPTTNLYANRVIQLTALTQYFDTFERLTLTGTTVGTFSFEVCTDITNGVGVFIVDSAGNPSNVECVPLP